jgi:DNA-binding winged helix-turn-helix (wHTH) protein
MATILHQHRDEGGQRMPTKFDARGGRRGQRDRDRRRVEGAEGPAVASRSSTEAPGYPLVERRKGDRRKSQVSDSGLWRAIAMAAGQGLWINILAKEVVADGHKVALTPKEFEFLCLLASQPGRVYSDDEILRHLWPGSESATTAHVAQYAYRLRKKLGDCPDNPHCLINVKRFGYKLNCNLGTNASSEASDLDGR